MCSILVVSCFSMCLCLFTSLSLFFKEIKNPAAVWPSILFYKNRAAFEELRVCNCPFSCLLFFASFYFSRWCPPGPIWVEKASTLDPSGLYCDPILDPRGLKHIDTQTHTHTHTATPTDQQPTTQQTIFLKHWPGGMRVSD